MSDTLRLTILGCASSPGVPRINGDWGACDPTNPKNRRLRSSALVERIGPNGRTVVAIDCGPDFREQMLMARVARLDAVVLTHPHADHIHGMDDLRGYMLMQKPRIPVHSDAFDPCPGAGSLPLLLRNSGRQRLSAGGAACRDQRRRDILGRRRRRPADFAPFARNTARSIRWATGSDRWPIAAMSATFRRPPSPPLPARSHIVIDALQYRTHPSHLSVEQALDWIARLGVPKRR